MKEFSVTFVVSSDSSEKLRLARKLAASTALHLDALHTDVAKASDKVIVQHHRLGDYFSSVEIKERDATSFRLVFVPCPNADRYWKDLVVRILKSLRESGASIRTEK